MNLKEAQKEFAARFYLWAKDEIRKEAHADFPTLRRLESCGFAFQFLNYAQPLSAEDSIKLMTACLKRYMKEAAEAFGEAYSQQETDLVEGFTKSSLVGNPAQTELFGRQLEGEKNLFADRKVLRAALKAELKPIVGEKITKYGAATWTYLTPLGDWTVQTRIDTGGRYHQFNYDHLIGSPFHPFLYENPISVLSWLGLGGGVQWNYLTPSDVPETVNSLGFVCSHFMAVVPKLLKGIELDR